MPSIQDVALGYVPLVATDANPQAFCVPLMGFHEAPLTEFTAPGQFVPVVFDKVLIEGH